MKRRSFLQFLGLAPAAPLIAKAAPMPAELQKIAEAVVEKPVRYVPIETCFSVCTVFTVTTYDSLRFKNFKKNEWLV